MTCTVCGTETFDWQKDEFNIYGNLCPECSDFFEEYFCDEDEEELEMLAGLL